MIYLSKKNLLLIVLSTILSTTSIAQNINCFMPAPANPPSNFAGQNATLCNDYLNYIPIEDHYSNTPTKVIKVNFHYFLTNDPLNPRNLSETTGFNLNDNWNTGYQFAKDLIDKCNLFADQNAPSLIPPGNGYPNHPIKIKFEIYKDPNDPNDKGVYFHRFSDWWDNVNNAPNTNSDYWYSHIKGGTLSPIYLKNNYAVHGTEVIDIFFQDNVLLNDLGGIASGWGMVNNAGYCGSDMYEGWNNNLQWTDNWAGTMFHEVGHLLNLYHSWENDGCSDTYQSGSTCYQWPGTGGTLYDNNYMSYCPKPMSAFTPEQLGRINYFIESNNPRYVKDEVICKADALQDITILSGQNIVWNSTKHLKGSVIVEPNATLTIKCDVFFKELAYIKVKEKGHLIIDGGRVTSECDNKLWFGIFVLGDETKQQNVIEQGKVETKNDAVIENAIIGIRTGDFYYDQSDLSWPAFCGKTGGIIQSNNTIFRNNRKAVEFMKYHNILPAPYNIEVDNISYFIECTFVLDDYIKGYQYQTPFQWGPEFVTAWDVQGVNFSYCTFKDETSANYNSDLIFKPTAIGSFSAKYYIKYCTFQNLYAGIWAESILSPLDFVDIKYSTLDNVQQNITSINQFNDKIAGNTVINQPATNSTNLSNNLIYSWGIYMKGSSMYKVHDNNISSTNPVGLIQNTGQFLIYSSDCNIGVLSSNGWVEPNLIAENAIRNQSASIQTEDENYDLQIGCNTHEGNQLNWFVNPTSTSGYLNDQGILYVNDLIANNKFMDGCNNLSLKNQIRSELTNFFTYNDITGNPNKPDLNCVTSNVNLALVTAPNPSCNQYTPIIGQNGYGNGDLSIDNVNLAGLTNFEKQSLLFKIASNHSDKGEYMKLIKTLETLNSYEAGKLLVALYYELNNANKAEEWLSKISSSSGLQRDEIKLNSNTNYPVNALNTDKLDFLSFYTPLIKALKNNRNIYQLNDFEIQELVNLSTKDSRSGLMAKGLLSFIKKIPKTLIPETPEIIGNKGSEQSIQSKAIKVTCYPNPFENAFTLEVNLNENENADFLVTDILGNKIKNYNITNATKDISIETKSWNTGIFYGTLFINGAKTKTFKLTKN